MTMTRRNSTLAEQDRAIAEATASFPKTFGLRAFPDRLLRIARNRYSHFFTDQDMQLVVEAQMPDGSWADMGRNTPEFLKSELRQKSDDRYDLTHPQHRELMLNHRSCVCTPCQHINVPTTGGR